MLEKFINDIKNTQSDEDIKNILYEGLNTFSYYDELFDTKQLSSIVFIS